MGGDFCGVARHRMDAGAGMPLSGILLMRVSLSGALRFKKRKPAKDQKNHQGHKKGDIGLPICEAFGKTMTTHLPQARLARRAFFSIQRHIGVAFVAFFGDVLWALFSGCRLGHDVSPSCFQSIQQCGLLWCNKLLLVNRDLAAGS